MKRWMVVSVLLAIAVAPAAVAGDCSVCVSPTWCDSTQEWGGIGCILYPDPWCEEIGSCGPRANPAQRSFRADWKVAAVHVLTPEAEQLPVRTAAAVVVAANERSPK